MLFPTSHHFVGVGSADFSRQLRSARPCFPQAEKAKQLLYQAKYGRFGLGDPFHSMQRDSDFQRDTSFDEAAVKAMYDNQLMQLENLIATQRKAQQRMREQLAAVEKRYHKVSARTHAHTHIDQWWVENAW